MIEGAQILLDKVRMDDSPTLFAWINDRDLVRLHGPFRSVDAADHDAWMQRLNSDPATRVFSIRAKNGGRLIGLLQLTGIHNIHRSVELRIRIGSPSDRGLGLGSEAIELAVNFAFTTLGMHRVWLNVFADNLPGISAYERCGFTVEGVQRDGAFIEGEWKDVVMMARLHSAQNAFTEEGFRGLIVQLKAGGYRFAGYGQTATDRHVIWRHDVDCSMHRAVRLAEIEADEGVGATYFVNPRSAYYNLLEPEITRLLYRLRALGHTVGLHFDTEAHNSTEWTQETLEAALRRERDLLEIILGAPVEAVSWHNPDQSNLLSFEADQLAGLVNVYADRYRRDYVYCSDSNGYWRFKPMPEVIAEAHPRLHLLTHPEWWTPEPMSPSARIDRSLHGRARKVRRDYDRMLARAGRKNKTD